MASNGCLLEILTPEQAWWSLPCLRGFCAQPAECPHLWEQEDSVQMKRKGWGTQGRARHGEGGRFVPGNLEDSYRGKHVVRRGGTEGGCATGEGFRERPLAE